jgi:hypothetical protein
LEDFRLMQTVTTEELRLLTSCDLKSQFRQEGLRTLFFYLNSSKNGLL